MSLWRLFVNAPLLGRHTRWRKKESHESVSYQREGERTITPILQTAVHRNTVLFILHGRCLLALVLSPLGLWTEVVAICCTRSQMKTHKHTRVVQKCTHTHTHNHMCISQQQKKSTASTAFGHRRWIDVPVSMSNNQQHNLVNRGEN